MKLSEAIENYLIGLQGIRSKATVAWYGYMLAELKKDMGDEELKTLGVDRLRRWRARLFERNYSVWTIRDYLRACRTFFKWLVVERKIKVNPAVRLELPKEPQRPRLGITEDDRDKILCVAAESPRDLALVYFIGATMCRAGGAAGLRWCDIDLVRRRALVHEKGDKSREVYFGTETVASLKAWAEVCGSEWVFPSKKGGGHLSPNGIYQIFERLAERAGVVGSWSPHKWRHGGARGMLKKGANLAQVSQILGHKDVSITVRFYGVLDGDELQDCADSCGWMG